MQQVDQEITNNTTTTMSSPPSQENMTHQLSPALEPGSKKPPPDPQHEEPLSSETKNVEKGSCNSKSPEDETVVNACRGPSRLRERSSTTSATAAEAAAVEDGSNMSSGRERLKRHRVEVAGRVWIPDMWGQEGLLKDWIDCTAFDASLANSSIMSARASLVEEGRRANATTYMSARASLVEEGRRANATTYRLENSC